MRSVDVAAELRRLGVEYKTRSDGQYRIRCPFHDDETPSCDVSQKKQGFYCRACGVNGPFITLVSRISGEPKHIVLARLESSSEKPVEASVIMRFHERIWSAGSLLRELYKRGVTDSIIKRFLLGENGGRVTIPIQNYDGMFVNIRSYLPGATDDPKTINQKGRSKLRIYPFSQLQYDQILFTAGEIKALVGIEKLEQHGVGCICLTGGEMEWLVGCEEYFRGKRVWIGGDIDEVGQRAAQHKCSRLVGVADWVGNIEWPLDPKKYPTGDLNDVVAEGYDLWEILQSTPKWSSKISTTMASDQDSESLSLVSIKQAVSSENALKRFKSTVSITAIGQDSYFVPKQVAVSCNKNQTNCSICPIYEMDPNPEIDIPPESPAILAIMDSTSEGIPARTKEALGIPECGIVKFDIKSHYKVLETRVQRALDLVQPDSDRVAVPAILVDQETELNETYEIVGRTVPHPKNQRSTAIVSKAKTVVDALSSFELAKPEELERFRPKLWTPESIDETLSELYNEYALNITEIFERQPIHTAVDLAYHSVLAMKVGSHVQKGTVEVLIVGDTAQGKSFTAERMQLFYGLGERVECKNATPAGLLGGLEQIGGKWFVQWGVIPQHDRRLVILEELKGMKPEVFAKLTDMRSSGMAEIPKIIRRKAQARTRLIVLSNPRKSNSMASYSHGVNAIMELIGSPEDVRRFDMGLIVNKNEISEEITNEQREKIEPTFTMEQARRLILWAWTRTVDQVILPDETIKAMLSIAQQLNKEFIDDIPLLDKGSTRFKLLRLAAALACRTFSSSNSYLEVLVRPCHVEWIAEFLRKEYSKESHGYLAVSQRTMKRQELVSGTEILAHFSTMPEPKFVIEHMLHADEFDQEDVSNWSGWEKEEAGITIRKLVRNNAITREGRVYRKTAPFTALLRQSLLNGAIKRPEHVDQNGEADSSQY